MTAEPAREEWDVHSQLAAQATGPVVQAGSISGGVHMHATPQPAPVPRLLPPATHWFVGRQNELETLSTVWRHGGRCAITAITAIVGAGGIGKTSLVLHWAHQHLDWFPDGQLYVDLRGHGGDERQAATAVRTLLDALGADPVATPAGFDAQVGRYRSLVAGKRILIVLDNVRDSAQVAPLLPGSRTCTVLITSRNRLEGLHSVVGAHRIILAELTEPDARKMLVRRLGPHRAESEPDAFAELLDYCAGLPLALAVVAGRLATRATFPLAAVAAELRETATRLGAFDIGDPTTNLTTVLSSSYNALRPTAAEVLGLIAMIPAPDIGWRAACRLTGLPAIEVRALMRELERASLVDEHQPSRWRMHDLVRLYAVEQARSGHTANRRDASLRRLVDYYLHTARAGDRLLDQHRVPILMGVPATDCQPEPLSDHVSALDWFDAEYRCVTAAQQVAAAQGWHIAVWQLAWAMHTYRWQRGHIHDQVNGWRAALSAAQLMSDTSAQATAHRLLGAACVRIGSLDEAFWHLDRALDLFTREHDAKNQAHAHRALARAWGRQSAHERALAHATHALTLYRVTDSPRHEADALDLMCLCEAELGRLDQAHEHGMAALSLYRAHHDPDGEATTLDSLGYIAHLSGRHTAALDHYRQALALFHGRNTYHEANTLDRLGEIHAELGQAPEAKLAWQQALELFRSQRRTTNADRVIQRLNLLEVEINHARKVHDNHH